MILSFDGVGLDGTEHRYMKVEGTEVAGSRYETVLFPVA
jgi:hypothetical protein